ncbi:hypothetical protein NDN08_001915 [Rhodosorus marinus]|uniref:Uncharacterized protein n=1 Tax=Rhodosorus marinus TaxID=101924 RepID=A0AAV8UWD3_9RHOD|nr:hypothetical protein NDN08_001915 [Rhodosorus marinus]
MASKALIIGLSVVLLSLLVDTVPVSIRREWTMTAGKSRVKLMAHYESVRLMEHQNERTGTAVLALAVDADGASELLMTVNGRRQAGGRFEIRVQGADSRDSSESQREEESTDVLWWFGHFETSDRRALEISPQTKCVDVSVLHNDVVDAFQILSDGVTTNEYVDARKGSSISFCRA